MTTAIASGQLIQAETQWIHFFRSMVDSGALAKMSGSSLKVYLVIKAHANYHTGIAFPGMKTIAEKSGISLAQVKRAIPELESLGYISKSKNGRSNEYRVREVVRIQDDTGNHTGVASWDYKPSMVQETVDELKGALRAKDIGNARMVHIERLQVNINQVAAGGVVVNLQEALAQIHPSLRERLGVLLARAGAIDAGTYTQIIDDPCHE
ncbi:helix-turn-helix domain-containing protein [Burkholderia multivorans]|uniref:helix-turn-helix domain-containing protein n=1 Tax=Burkholderia multivorans TaxID=87883 RepID=UPI00075C8C41|nr:helix-turn-helix domain-containing protein [Burkholderia multivorans]KVS17324.1 hypothetical protein WK33_04925 [Burkholderia multivorans]MBU9211289.1 helix-turn-helix domain-containing protein [Burkholderia multivorans]MBU9230522.1 helix-turn-helix domain-containing protein [Burkholderia multivorans]MBU9251600.1 helix-turn-helix domain-containing protein [Burkholderia multivorans]MBU9680492.1 helix-turn-helix domain-containing protein [Burkholderia multivorans]